MINAVQTFNNPSITFKSEHFIVLSVISWTYLMHAYYRQQGIDYRCVDESRSTEKRRVFKKTSHGESLLWSLDECLDHSACPLEKDMAANLKLLIGIRHEIEHRMTTRIDNSLGSYFQANAIGFNRMIKSLFGDKYGIDGKLSFSIQFVGISEPQANNLNDITDLPRHIAAYIKTYKETLDEDILTSPNFSYSILFTRKTVNHPSQADVAYRFIEEDSATARDINQQYVYKEKEKPKLTAKEVIAMMHEKGFDKFNTYHHTQLWKLKNAKNPTYGVQLLSQWFWYPNWIPVVENHCKTNYRKYKSRKTG